jgi:predicted nucleotidyltransferase
MLDYLAIFKKLNEKRVKYIVVGGIAVNLYGIPRMTYDIDLILDIEDKNLERFLRLLKEWGFKPKVPVDIMDFAKKDKREDWIRNKNMKAFNLVNPEWAMSEIDIIINTPVDYKKASKNIYHINLQDVSIPTISIDDLIKMKQNTGRQQDKADIRYLMRLRNEKR